MSALTLATAGVGGCLPAAASNFAECVALPAEVRGTWLTLLGGFFGVGAVAAALAAEPLLTSTCVAHAALGSRLQCF